MKKLLLLVILIGMTAFHAQGKIREKRSIVRLETTMGNIRIALNDETPVHRDNFLKLVSEGFYDGTLFHRVVKDFVIQAGDPDSKQAPGGKILGEGGPGYMLAPEIDLPFQYHKRGAVAMAREDDANNPDRLSNGSQFYIVWGNTAPGNWPLPGRDYEVAYMVILKPTGKWSKNTSPPGAHPG